MADIKIFTKFSVYPLLRGGTLIQFSIHPLFRAPGPVTFTLQWSRSGVEADPEDWQNVTDTDPITNANTSGLFAFTDNRQYFWSVIERMWYRVLLTDVHNVTTSSGPQTSFEHLTRTQYLTAKQILRQENIRLGRGQIGTCGKLFKRKNWGPRCDFSHCLDPDTNQVTNPNCPTCFGTGFIGGYYTPEDYPLGIDPLGDIEPKVNEGQGLYDGNNVTGRGTTCPLPQAYDLWVSLTDDTRWYIRRIDYIAAIAGYPLIVDLHLNQANPQDAVYALSMMHTG